MAHTPPKSSLLAALAGCLLLVVAALYFAEPAHSLPSFFPGHEAGSAHHHVKHGIAAFLVGRASYTAVEKTTCAAMESDRRPDPRVALSARGERCR